jgi:hypothetical protein
MIGIHGLAPALLPIALPLGDSSTGGMQITPERLTV